MALPVKANKWFSGVAVVLRVGLSQLLPLAPTKVASERLQANSSKACKQSLPPNCAKRRAVTPQSFSAGGPKVVALAACKLQLCTKEGARKQISRELDGDHHKGPEGKSFFSARKYHKQIRITSHQGPLSQGTLP